MVAKLFCLRPVVLIGFASMLLVGSVPFSVAEAASLTFQRWEGKASLISNPGPGETYYRLLANVRWDPQAPRDPGRYRLAITLPDGRTTRRELRRGDGPRSNLLGIYVPVDAVRNRLPEDVQVRVVLEDASSGAALGPALVATIEQFPTPRVAGLAGPTGPFGWGQPLEASNDSAQTLPRPGPDGLRFVRIPGSENSPGFFLSRAEATNQQVSQRLPDHDPNAGRSDEFLLDEPEQPAINLTPQQAIEYLSVLSMSDSSGITYRLPTAEEWQRAALAGQSSQFWWGDEPEHPEGANFLGPEPLLPTDTTASANDSRQPFSPNPWGLLHTFGNVAEWATTDIDSDTGGFQRMGGHFRTDPAEEFSAPMVENPDDLGPDPFVGLRPAFDLDTEQGGELIRSLLAYEPTLSGVEVSFDPDRATATLTGTVTEPSTRALADDVLKPVWFLAAVENEIETPKAEPGKLALLGQVAGQARRSAPLGKVQDEVPVLVRWTSPLPVEGSNWYVNVFRPGGGSTSHKLNSRPGNGRAIIAHVPIGSVRAREGGPVSVALSLGAPATSPGDPKIVSNLAEIRWKVGESGPGT